MNWLFRYLKGVKRQRNLESLPTESNVGLGGDSRKWSPECRVQEDFHLEEKRFLEKLTWLSSTADWDRRYRLEELKIYCWLPSRGVSWLSLRVEFGLLSVQHELFLITLHMPLAAFSFIFSMLHSDLSLCKGLFSSFLLKSISKDDTSVTPT